MRLLGDQDITRISDALGTIRDQFNRLLGRSEEKEKRCEAHSKDVENLQDRLTDAEARLTAIESAKSMSGSWVTTLLAGAGVCISIYAALK